MKLKTFKEKMKEANFILLNKYKGVCFAISKYYKEDDERIRVAFIKFAKPKYSRSKNIFWLRDTAFAPSAFNNYGYRSMVLGDFADYCIKTKLYKTF